MESEPIKPAVILKNRFIQPGHVLESGQTVNYSGAIDYIDRDESYKYFLDYMDNPAKATNLFTFFEDEVSDERKDILKKQYQRAQNKGGLMWQTVISFDNDFLKEQGYINGNKLESKMIMDATRKAMSTMIAKENMMSNVIWSAAIHYNTDNIHVHVSMVEKQVKRKRGKFKQSTLDASKQKVATHLFDRSKSMQQIDQIVRTQMIGRLKEENLDELHKIIKQTSKALGKKGKGPYQYGRLNTQEKKAINEGLNKLKKREPYKELFNRLDKMLDDEVKINKRLYGEKSRASDYKGNKLEDTNKRLGNLLLKQIKEYDQYVYVDKPRNNKISKSIKKRAKFELYSRKKEMAQIKYMMKRFEKEQEYQTQKEIDAFYQSNERSTYEN